MKPAKSDKNLPLIITLSILGGSSLILCGGFSLGLLTDDNPATTSLPDKLSTATTTTNTISTTAISTTILAEPTTPTDPPSKLTATFFDVGQGDAALISCDGHYMLIDGGDTDDSSKMYSALQSNGIDTLDIVVASHAHSDHIGGLAGALNYATADLILCPVTTYDSDAFVDFAKYAGEITVPEVGDTYALGDAEIQILGVNGGAETNDTSIILSLEHGENRFIFTGDAEREAEQAVLDNYTDLEADVLKIGHHGSDTSTSYVWLDAILPEYAVISVGKNNEYGHPTDAVLSRLRDAESKVYRTDLHGDITFISNGYSLSVDTAKYTNYDDIYVPGVIPTEPPQTEPPTNASVETVTKDYVLNTNTKKFHYPSCSSVKDIKPSNRSDYSGTRDDVINQGYKSCKRCNP